MSEGIGLGMDLVGIKVRRLFISFIELEVGRRKRCTGSVETKN